MQFTAEQLQEKWEELITYIALCISSPRKEQLLALYEKYQERILLSPASAKEHYHNAFPGGYLDHVLRVVSNALALNEVWATAGARTDNYTKEELVFSALNHDLGKIGDEGGEYYQPNLSEWHRLNQGKIYGFNPELTHMNVTDRAFYILQSEGIKITRNEYISIHCADGLYEEKNKAYFIGYEKEQQLRINLPFIIHHADLMALQIERDEWRKTQSDPAVQLAKASPQTYPKKGRSDPQKRNAELKKTFENSPSATALFDSLFNGKDSGKG